MNSEVIIFLENLANVLDEWAEQSRKHWSTHQVEANIREANNCRRMAAKLKLEEKKENKDG